MDLIYLGWGKRDFAKDPVIVHRDRGSNYYILLHGEIILTVSGSAHIVRGPSALIFDPGCAFGLSARNRKTPKILVWVWRGRPQSPALLPPPDGYLVVHLHQCPLDSLMDLHFRCRDEVSRADEYLPRTLAALRELLEVEILRSSRVTSATDDVRWNLVNSWMINNLSIHAPVPALCDYLSMSSSTLHRFFLGYAGVSPGAYFRQLKAQEALRLIREEGWQVKAAAYHLGYRYPNDLSRTFRKHGNDATE
ncbi:MAG: helix-turn-helix domain-containing protein [Candidatus Korobacteraceae bacterium]